MSLRNPHETVESDELPIVVESHDHPAKTDVRIVEGECGNCGYDRIKVSQQIGFWYETCMLCGAQRHDGGDGWELPTTDRERRDDLREYADMDESPVVRHSENLIERGHGVEVFGYENSSVIKMFERDGDRRTGGYSLDLTSLTKDRVVGLLKALEQSEDFVTEFVEEEMDKAVTKTVNAPPNRNATHAGILEHKGVSVPLWIAMNQEGYIDEPIHFDPRADGISV